MATFSLIERRSHILKTKYNVFRQNFNCGYVSLIERQEKYTFKMIVLTYVRYNVTAFFLLSLECRIHIYNANTIVNDLSINVSTFWLRQKYKETAKNTSESQCNDSFFTGFFSTVTVSSSCQHYSDVTVFTNERDYLRNCHSYALYKTE